MARRAVAEALGMALLLAAVVGSGIMGERLAAGNAAIALLANTIATGAALVALILALDPSRERILIPPSPSPTPGKVGWLGATSRSTSPRRSEARSPVSPQPT